MHRLDLAGLETLLGAVTHASTEQRSAVDALVSTSADLLERVGSRFSNQLESETSKLDHAAANGLLLLQAGPDVLRFVPALNIGDEDVAEGLARLRIALQAFAAA